MTDSLPLQYLDATRTSIESALRDAGLVGPTQPCAYLDRLQPVGENEQKPLAIIRRGQTDNALDSSTCALDHTIRFQVLIHVKRSNLTTSFSRMVDPVWQVVHAAVMGTLNSFPWVQDVIPVGNQPEPADPEGQSVPGLMVLFYTVQMMTNRSDLASPS
jgi:hypothetical protein